MDWEADTQRGSGSSDSNEEESNSPQRDNRSHSGWINRSNLVDPPIASSDGVREDRAERFWPIIHEEIRKVTADDFRTVDLPLARVKKIMKLDDDVRMISAETPILLSKAADIFIRELTMRAWSHTVFNKRRTLQRADVSNAAMRCDQFDFLIDILPRDDVNYRSQVATSPGFDQSFSDPAITDMSNASDTFAVPATEATAGMPAGFAVATQENSSNDASNGYYIVQGTTAGSNDGGSSAATYLVNNGGTGQLYDLAGLLAQSQQDMSGQTNKTFDGNGVVLEQSGNDGEVYNLVGVEHSDGEQIPYLQFTDEQLQSLMNQMQHNNDANGNENPQASSANSGDRPFYILHDSSGNFIVPNNFVHGNFVVAEMPSSSTTSQDNQQQPSTNGNGSQNTDFNNHQ